MVLILFTCSLNVSENTFLYCSPTFLAINSQYSAEIPIALSFFDLKVKGSHELETDTFIKFFVKKSFSSCVKFTCCLKFT